MAHLKGFGIENFRVIGEPTWFDFAPKLHRTDRRWLYTAVTRGSEQVLSWWF